MVDVGVAERKVAPVAPGLHLTPLLRGVPPKQFKLAGTRGPPVTHGVLIGQIATLTVVHPAAAAAPPVEDGARRIEVNAVELEVAAEGAPYLELGGDVQLGEHASQCPRGRV